MMRAKILRKKWKSWGRYSNRNFEHDYVIIKFQSRYMREDDAEQYGGFLKSLAITLVLTAIFIWCATYE